jgi:hypothetical protein
MKRAIPVLVILGIGAVGYLTWGPEKQADSESLTFVPGKVEKKVVTYRDEMLKKALPEKVTMTKAYQAFVNPTLSSPLYLRNAGVRPKEGKEFLSAAFSNLKNCFLEGCGQGPDSEGFFDPGLTVATLSLKRILEITAEDPDKLDVKDWLETEDLVDMLNSTNKGLRKAALKNLFNITSPTKVFKEVLTYSRDLEGYSAGDVVAELKPFLNQNNIQEFIDNIEAIAREKDSFTITEVLENVDSIKVTRSQIEQIGTPLCRFVGKKKEAGNVKAMDYSLNNMAQSEMNLKLSSYCL